MQPRLFLAIRPPADIRAQLIDLMGGVAGARWQGDDQFHLTLCYLGETPETRAEELVEALTRIRFNPFDISLRSAGYFEKKGRAHTLWAGVDPAPELLALQKKIERCCTALALPREDRVYHPHITLARLNCDPALLGPFCAQLTGRPLGSWHCESYILYESHLRPEGSLYEAVRVYRATD